MAAQTVEIDVVINTRNNTTSGLSSTQERVDRLSQSVRRTRQEMDRLGNTNARPTVGVMDRASSALSRINSGLNRFAGRTVKAGVRIIDYATRPLRAIKNTLFSIKGLVAAVGLGMAGNQLISKPLALADAYSSAKIGFSTLLGDKKGQKMMNKLDEFAKATPFKTSGVIGNAQKMMSMGWDAKDIVKDMRTIGDAAAATGKGDQGFESIVRALSQIKTKGKLSTEELNQLAEAGIAAKAMLAENLGYGTGDAGIAKMTKDLEDGAIASDKAIQALLKGMKQYKGTMEKTANETVEGLKSQIEDTFEINVFRRWGQGLQDGAKRGFGSIVDLLDRSEGSLKKFGDTVYEIGKELSNWAADKLENTIDKIIQITNRDDFKNASIFGKAKILWDEVIAQPFSKWWSSKGKPFMAKKMGEIGEGLGSGLSKGLLALLGIKVDVTEATSIGGSFATGFAKGFEGKKVWDALIDAAGRAFKSGFKVLFSGSWLTNIIAAKLGLQLTAGIVGGINRAMTIWNGTGATIGGGADGAGRMTLAGMGLRGVLGSASEGTGILGFGANTARSLGAGTFASGASLSAGGLSALGLGSVAGGVLGAAGLVKGGANIYKAFKADNSNDQKHYGWRAGTSIGMVGAGAGIGAAIGSAVPVLGTGVGALIGAGIGGLGALFAGNKVADSISGVSKSTKELREEALKLKDANMKKHFGEWEMSAADLQKEVTNIIGKDTIRRVNKFNEALSNLSAVEQSLDTNSDDIQYAHERIINKEKLSASDIKEYSAALSGYTTSMKEYLSLDKKTTRSAFKLLYGDDTKGLQKMTKGVNKAYGKLEKELEKKTKKLNKVMSKAFKDGKITKIEEKEIQKILEQIEEIEERIRQKKEEAERKAAYELAEEKYSLSDMDADSYKKMMEELNAQNEIDNKAYDDAYITAKAKIDMQFDTNGDGTVNGKEVTAAYKEKVEEIKNKWRSQKEETLEKTINISFGIVKDNYKEEFNGFDKVMNDPVLMAYNANKVVKAAEWKVQGSTVGLRWNENTTKKLNGLHSSFLSNAGITEDIQVQMEELYEAMKPEKDRLNEIKGYYEGIGKEVPTWVSDGLATIDKVELMSGSKDAFYTMIGEELAKSDPSNAQKLLKEDIPKKLRKGIESGLEKLEFSTNLKLTADKSDIDTSHLDKTTQDVIDKMQEKGVIFEKNGEVKIKTKNGKVDTTGLDEKLKTEIERLEKEGILVVKDGKVTVNASEVDTSPATTSVNDKISLAMVNPFATPGYADITVKENSTDTSPAKSGAKTSIDSAFSTPFGTSTTVNVSAKQGSISGLSSIKSNFDSVVGKLFSSVNPVATVNIKARRYGGPTSSQKKNKKNNAYGSRVDSPILTWVGENSNREYIIPVTAGKRQRGLDLWMQAGKDLGVMNNANGGVYGGGSSISRLLSSGNNNSSVQTTDSSQNTNRNKSINVEVGGVNIQITGSGDGAASDISNNKDMICSTIAEALQEAFENLPLATV